MIFQHFPRAIANVNGCFVGGVEALRPSRTIFQSCRDVFLG